MCNIEKTFSTTYWRNSLSETRQITGSSVLAQWVITALCDTVAEEQGTKCQSMVEEEEEVGLLSL